MAKKIRSITIDNDVLNKAEKICKKEHRSFSGLVEYLIEKYINSGNI